MYLHSTSQPLKMALISLQAGLLEEGEVDEVIAKEFNPVRCVKEKSIPR